MLIYKLTFYSGKRYIGQTVKTLEHRVTQHRNAANNGSSLAVHCAWRSHGEPVAEIVSQHESMEDLHAAEIETIRLCGTLSPGGYNVGYGGETAPSCNPEVAAKISEKAKARKATPKTRATLRDVMAKRWDDPAYRERQSVALCGSWTPERRAAASARQSARTGWKHSAETREKIAAKALNMSAETRAKMSAAAKGKPKAPRTDQTKERLAHSVAASWQDPDIRARRSAAIRAGHQRRKEHLAAAKEAIAS